MRASHDITFKWRDHSWTSLPQEIGQLFPGSFQHRVVLDVAAQVIVVLLEEVEPGPPALHPLHAKKKNRSRFQPNLNVQVNNNQVGLRNLAHYLT